MEWKVKPALFLLITLAVKFSWCATVEENEEVVEIDDTGIDIDDLPDADDAPTFEELDGGDIRMDDLVLSKKQRRILFDKTPLNATVSSYAAMESGVVVWPMGVIPYVLRMSDFVKDPDHKSQLREAMDVWEDLTCLNFKEKSHTDKKYVFIHDSGDGCYALLGQRPGYPGMPAGAQPLSLQDPGCRNFGTYLHEIGHTIGLVHEHQLPQRDAHVHFYGSNINPTDISQLEIYGPRAVNSYNAKYDLSSIMHYDVFSFSIDDTSPTLGVDNPWLAQHIGRRYSMILGFSDVLTVNKMYRCAANCPRAVQMSCIEGYINKNCECITAPMYYQRYCKDEEGYSAFCGSLAPQGKCDVENYLHQKFCAKTCGFCPRFLPGQGAIGPLKARGATMCVDRYPYPEKCRTWAGKFCSTRWMHRYCRKSCGKCQSEWGDCPNMEQDSICDSYAANGYCPRKGRSGGLQNQSMMDFIRTRCADSCGTCGFRKQDLGCRNELDDAECLKFAQKGSCEKKPLQMYEKCASTCNRCYWNKGNCNNQMPDQKCYQLALENWCIKGDPAYPRTDKHPIAISKCKKTCDTC